MIKDSKRNISRCLDILETPEVLDWRSHLEVYFVLTKQSAHLMITSVMGTQMGGLGGMSKDCMQSRQDYIVAVKKKKKKKRRVARKIAQEVQ